MRTGAEDGLFLFLSFCTYGGRGVMSKFLGGAPGEGAFLTSVSFRVWFVTEADANFVFVKPNLRQGFIQD